MKIPSVIENLGRAGTLSLTLAACGGQIAPVPENCPTVESPSAILVAENKAEILTACDVLEQQYNCSTIRDKTWIECVDAKDYARWFYVTNCAHANGPGSADPGDFKPKTICFVGARSSKLSTR